MATITFHTNEEGIPIADHGNDASLIPHTLGTGLGFFGGGFGISVPVGQYQTATYVTNSAGTDFSVQANNTKYVDEDPYPTSGVQVNGASTIGNSGIPNYLSTLNIRFEHTEAVRTQNCRLRIFDRADIANHAVGVTTEVYEVRHPNPTAVDTKMLTYRGANGTDEEHSWNTFTDDGGAVTDMELTPSPGASGLNTNAADAARLPETEGLYRNWRYSDGQNHTSTRHDWYVALSASPDSIGSKTDYGLYFTLEYL